VYTAKVLKQTEQIEYNHRAEVQHIVQNNTSQSSGYDTQIIEVNTVLNLIPYEHINTFLWTRLKQVLFVTLVQ